MTCCKKKSKTIYQVYCCDCNETTTIGDPTHFTCIIRYRVQCLKGLCVLHVCMYVYLLSWLLSVEANLEAKGYTSTRVQDQRECSETKECVKRRRKGKRQLKDVHTNHHIESLSLSANVVGNMQKKKKKKSKGGKRKTKTKGPENRAERQVKCVSWRPTRQGDVIRDVVSPTASVQDR